MNAVEAKLIYKGEVLIKHLIIFMIRKIFKTITALIHYTIK